MTTDPKTPAGNTDQAFTEQPPEHPSITPEEVAAMVAEEEGVSVENLAGRLRNYVETFGPSEVELNGQIYTVDSEDES